MDYEAHKKKKKFVNTFHNAPPQEPVGAKRKEFTLFVGHDIFDHTGAKRTGDDPKNNKIMLTQTEAQYWAARGFIEVEMKDFDDDAQERIRELEEKLAKLEQANHGQKHDPRSPRDNQVTTDLMAGSAAISEGDAPEDGNGDQADGGGGDDGGGTGEASDTEAPKRRSRKR